jgi:glycosyltransferase involved in cell wall biosynthesis
MASTIPVVDLTGEERTSVRAACGAAGDGLLVAYFGFLHPNKGMERLLEAFALVYARRPASRLVMLSRFEPDADPYHALLKSKAAALGLRDAVRWAGYLSPPEVSRHLGASDIAFLPFADGVSLRRLSFLTAMSHGMPVVTTREQAGEETLGLKDGVNVLLLNAGDEPAAFAEALLRLASDTGLRRDLGRRGREWSLPFQWPVVAEKTVRLYDQLVRAKGAGK